MSVRASVRAACDLLGRHVVDGSDHQPFRGQSRRGVELLREPEVGQVRVLLAVLDRDQDVCRLDVSVHEPAAMCGVKCGRQLFEQVDGPGRLDRSLLRKIWRRSVPVT